MSQMSFSDLEFAGKKRKTQKERMFEKLDAYVPWNRLVTILEPHYSGKAKTGRPSFPLLAMLKIHLLQVIYNLSDPGMEDHLYDVASMRKFVGLDIDRIPDETTLLNFRHFLERHGLGEKLFAEINAVLAKEGLILKEGSILDASIISAPPSTKNKDKRRDPEMSSTAKGNNWFFGMKMHIGVDDVFGLIHSVATTPASVHDIEAAHRTLHGEEERVWGDAGFSGIDKRGDMQGASAEFMVAMRPGQRRKHDKGSLVDTIEKAKASVRAKVEHPFLYIKKHFGYSKVRYKGLAKNTNRLMVLAGITNLFIAERYRPA